jgi:MFS family permease
MDPHAAESARLTPGTASERSISNKYPDKPSFFVAVKSQVMESLEQVYGSLSVLRSLPILLLLVSFLIQPFTRQSVDLSIRYVSNRFHWKLREAGFLLSLRACINFVLLLALLPGLSRYLTKCLHFSSTGKDLLLAQLSVVVLVIGSLLIAISPTIVLTIIGMVIFTLGNGTTALTRSLVTSLVDQEHVGRLYAAIGLVETLGSLTAGPTLAALYSLGLQLQGPWVGLPFFALAIVCFVGAIGIWSFGYLARNHPSGRLPSGEEAGVDENSLLVMPDSAEDGARNVV